MLQLCSVRAAALASLKCGHLLPFWALFFFGGILQFRCIEISFRRGSCPMIFLFTAEGAEIAEFASPRPLQSKFVQFCRRRWAFGCGSTPRLWTLRLVEKLIVG